MTAMSGRKVFVAPKQETGFLGKILSVLALVGGILFYMGADKLPPALHPVGVALLTVGILYWFAGFWLHVYENRRRGTWRRQRCALWTIPG